MPAGDKALVRTAYERIRCEREVFDANTLITAALAELRARPLDPPYSMLVVDECKT
ncbi:hypothetical protein [Nocardia sp. CA-120079]|uniref:hypothetical protein n=1 Tax=Nocardia sp. CA-120079 TaxID=3239974 RepID=UPI003D992078